MALLGQAAVAMWWDITADLRTEFEDWHSHEHFPERMRIAGFRRGTRWASIDGGEGWFVLYELDRHETLASPGYLARLNQPTPWSVKMMPHHRHMVRSQCRVVHSHGGALGGLALTLRLRPAAGRALELSRYLEALSAQLVTRPPVVAAHLLRTETPLLPVTTEQAIRGGPDATADWIFLVTGLAAAALTHLEEHELSETGLQAHGAAPGAVAGIYALSCVATPDDFA